MKTRDKLAAELRKIAEQASPENAVKYEAFAVRAATGEFDDYSDSYACPITQLYNELIEAGFTKFAARVAEGEFDATKEESDEWANSAAGKLAFDLLRNGPRGGPVPPPPDGGLGDAPIEKEYQDIMRDVGHFIDDLFNGDAKGDAKKTGFILMVFPLNDHNGRCNYISNGNREDVVTLLKGQLARFQGQPEVSGHA